MLPKIHKNVDIGKNAIIDENVEIGRLAKKNRKSVLQTVIGDNCVLRRGTIIYAGVKIGDNFQTGHNALIRQGNLIGHNVSIGSFTEIALRNTIGDNVRIHSGCFLEDVTLENDVFVGPKVTFTNDPHPSCPTLRSCFGGAKVKNGVMIGGGVTILPHVRIGKEALIGAGSVVVDDIPPRAVAVGNPARKIKEIRDIVCKRSGKVHKPYEKYSSG